MTKTIQACLNTDGEDIQQRASEIENTNPNESDPHNGTTKLLSLQNVNGHVKNIKRTIAEKHALETLPRSEKESEDQSTLAEKDALETLPRYEKESEDQSPFAELKTSWSLLFNTTQDIQNGRHIGTIGKFQYLEDFWRYYSYLTKPNELPNEYNLFMFRKEYLPDWEEFPKRASWLVSVPKNIHVNRMWEELLFACVGEYFDEPGMIGVGMTIGSSENTLSIWHADNKEISARVNIGEKLQSLLRLHPSDMKFMFFKGENHTKTLEKGVPKKNLSFFPVLSPHPQFPPEMVSQYMSLLNSQPEIQPEIQPKIQPKIQSEIQPHISSPRTLTPNSLPKEQLEPSKVTSQLPKYQVNEDSLLKHQLKLPSPTHDLEFDSALYEKPVLHDGRPQEIQSKIEPRVLSPIPYLLPKKKRQALEITSQLPKHLPSEFDPVLYDQFPVRAPRSYEIQTETQSDTSSPPPLVPRTLSKNKSQTLQATSRLRKQLPNEDSPSDPEVDLHLTKRSKLSSATYDLESDPVLFDQYAMCDTRSQCPPQISSQYLSLPNPQSKTEQKAQRQNHQHVLQDNVFHPSQSASDLPKHFLSKKNLTSYIGLDKRFTEQSKLLPSVHKLQFDLPSYERGVTYNPRSQFEKDSALMRVSQGIPPINHLLKVEYKKPEPNHCEMSLNERFSRILYQVDELVAKDDMKILGDNTLFDINEKNQFVEKNADGHIGTAPKHAHIAQGYNFIKTGCEYFRHLKEAEEVIAKSNFKGNRLIRHSGVMVIYKPKNFTIYWDQKNMSNLRKSDVIPRMLMVTNWEMGEWAYPGGQPEEYEDDMCSAASRELEEQTGVILKTRPKYSHSVIYRYPKGKKACIGHAYLYVTQNKEEFMHFTFPRRPYKEHIDEVLGLIPMACYYEYDGTAQSIKGLPLYIRKRRFSEVLNFVIPESILLVLYKLGLMSRSELEEICVLSRMTIPNESLKIFTDES